ncbi:hypothetical protein GCM10028803_28410 [Larkinella knui]|uniref:Uncharacterized protein n=1 Tax=Larkinella knui TaxID=2025310 RepID=A0A3P1CXS0_9BACT|nr:hypothetical protein [Larkinella knui]RRB17880.1 hypothetical protein EHT87_06280 [Larkinella knui]
MKILITVAMIGVWGWLAFMAIMTNSLLGRVTSIGIGILLNCALAFWYVKLDTRSNRANLERSKTEPIEEET